MENKYLAKYKNEMNEVINPLRRDWKGFAESELEILIRKFGDICRDETSKFRKEILSDTALAETLLEIGNSCNDNNKVLIEIVSSIDNMHRRYGLEITDNIFRFLIRQTKNRKVNFYVSIFITRLPQFGSYEHKWEYITSIPDIAPKDKSRNTFYHVINDNINSIPDELKADVIKVFENYMEKPNLHPHTVAQYSAVIQKLKGK